MVGRHAFACSLSQQISQCASCLCFAISCTALSDGEHVCPNLVHVPALARPKGCSISKFMPVLSDALNVSLLEALLQRQRAWHKG